MVDSQESNRVSLIIGLDTGRVKLYYINTLGYVTSCSHSLWETQAVIRCKSENTALEEVSKMLELKACPRCRGDLNTRRDMYGKYVGCLQCGYMLDIPEPSPLLSVPLTEKKKVA